MASPCVMSDLPQSVLEPILVSEAEKLGAEFRFHTEFLAQEQLSDGRIRTSVRHRGLEQDYKITSKYLIGADGARSLVLDSLGIPIDGKQLNTAFNVHIKGDFTKYFAHRPGSLNWILNPDAPDWSAVGNFRMVRPWTEFVVSMHPSQRDGKIFEPTKEDILKRLYQMIGDDTIPIEILSSFRWTINDQVARTWQKGNVLCIGDATHRHPPINGLGSNTCIGDAFNLAWKLAYVLKGLASPSILESLTLERKPVGDAIVRRANTGMEVHRTLWSLIGLTREEREVSTSLMAQATLKGTEHRRRFTEALEATDDELNALGMQMNQVYSNSPLTVVEPGDVPPNLSHINSTKQLLVSTYPGYHLPHVWVAKDGQSFRKSTLDLVGKGRFTLLTGIGGEAWKDATQRISNDGLVKISAYSIGFRQDYMDAYRDWVDVRGVDEDGAILVRPDHFVAWRCHSLAADPYTRLLRVLEQVLGLV
jgi:2-polyprenyl-6-methoxyphenol hydroxylase-like FAD-dependent oxidoreductase